MTGTLFRGGVLITQDAARRVLSGHSVAVSGGRILQIGPDADLAAAYSGFEVIDCSGHCVLPGLIDCHGHTGHSLMRGLSRATTAYWNEVVWHICHGYASDDFWYYDALVSAGDRARNGVTCCLNILERGAGIDLYEEGRCIARGYEEVGARHILSAGPGTYRYERIPMEEDLAQWQRDYDSTERLLREHAGYGLTGVFVGPSVMVMSRQSRGRIAPEHCRSLEECDRMHLRELSALAKRYNTGIQANCCGNLVEMMARDPDAFLGPHVLLSHCHHMTMQEMRLMAESHTNVGRSPEASLAYCPYSEMLFCGINVVLTSDSTGVVSSYDQFRNTRDIRMIEEFRQHGRRPSAQHLLDSITVSAARALLLQNEIGALEEGKQADIITVDMDQPHLFRWQADPVTRLMDAARGSDVDNVFVAGKPVVRQRQLVNIDEPAVARRAGEIALEAVKAGGLEPLWDKPAWGTVYATFNTPIGVPLRTAQNQGGK